MFRLTDKTLRGVALASVLFAFGFLLAGNPADSRAFGIDEAFGDREKFEKLDDIDKDKLAMLALKMRGLRFDLEDLFKDRQRLDRFFDNDVNKGFLHRRDMVKLGELHGLLMKEADERLFDLDDIGFDFDDDDKKDFDDKFKDKDDDRNDRDKDDDD